MTINRLVGTVYFLLFRLLGGACALLDKLPKICYA